MNNPNQPKEFDVVLGGKNPPPVDGVVLGGIEGVKNRLKSSDIEVQITALSEALNYGDAGLDVIVEVLQRSQGQIQHFIARLLRENGGHKGKEALLDYNYHLFFSKLENWVIKDFNPEIGIADPANTAYRLRLDWDRWRNSQATLPKSFELFLEDSHASQVEALLLPFGRTSSCKLLIDALVEAKNRLTGLKGLYIGDMYDYEYKTSDVNLSNMSPVLEAYPHLEILQVRGFGHEYYGDGLNFASVRHEHLKTLIVETGYALSYQVIEQICTLELPSLEYLELWLGNDQNYPVWETGDPNYPVWETGEEVERYSIDDSAFKHLSVIISGKVFPRLKYLGLRSCNYSDAVAQAIVNSPLINSLKVLDLSMGTLTGKGAKVLQDCIEVNQLNCRVITDSQNNSEEERYYALTE